MFWSYFSSLLQLPSQSYFRFLFSLKKQMKKQTSKPGFQFMRLNTPEYGAHVVFGDRPSVIPLKKTDFFFLEAPVVSSFFSKGCSSPLPPWCFLWIKYPRLASFLMNHLPLSYYLKYVYFRSRHECVRWKKSFWAVDPWAQTHLSK